MVVFQMTFFTALPSTAGSFFALTMLLNPVLLPLTSPLESIHAMRMQQLEERQDVFIFS